MSAAPRIAEAERPHVALAFVVDGATLHVLGTPTGHFAELRPIGVFTPDWAAIADATERVRNQMRRATDQGELSVAAYDDVVRACAFLFDELIPPTAKRWLRGGGGWLSLSLPPQLLGLPWELMHGGDAFVGASWAIGRLVQPTVDPHAPRPVPTDGASVLVVADPDGKLPEAYDEGIALADALRADGRSRVALRTTDVDAGFLRTEIRAHDIVHFAGHVDPEGWRMAESRFDRAGIDKLAGGAPLPSLVFANGCASVDEGDLAGSMLEGWLVGGVRHVVGPLFELPDALGRRFAGSFYAALSDGASIGEAMRLARAALAEELGDGVTAWGAYVLYGDPVVRYAPSTAVAAAEPRPPAPVRLAERGSEPVTVRAAAAAEPGSPPGRPAVALTTVVYVLVVCLVIALAAATVGLGALVAPRTSDWAGEPEP